MMKKYRVRVTLFSVEVNFKIDDNTWVVALVVLNVIIELSFRCQVVKEEPAHQS